MSRALWWIVPAYLLGMAAYEVSLTASGTVAGDTGEVLAFVAVLAIFAGVGEAALSLALAGPAPAIALLAPSAGAYLLTRFYSYDPYYAPSLQRYSENGNIGPAWIFAIVALSLLTGLLCWRFPRTGAVVTIVVLLALAVTAIGLVSGH